MKHLKFVVFIFIIFTCNGCYNYRELNQLAITSAIGIDKNEDGFKVVIQIMNTQKQSTDANASYTQPNFVTYESEGKTLQEAMRSVILESPRRLFVNHLRLLVISENVAKDGIHDILDFFARNTEFRKQFLVVISKNDETEDILNILTPLETLNAKNISDSIETDYKYLGMSNMLKYEEMLSIYLNPKTELALSTIQLQGSEKKGENKENIESSSPSAFLKLQPLAIFKGDKMIGYLTSDESIALGYIKYGIKNTIVDYECDNGKNSSIEILGVKNKITSKDNNIKIQITGSGNIKEMNCNVDLTKSKEIDKIQEKVENNVKNSIEESIDNIILEYNSDVFGFKELIYKTSPKNYNKLEKKYGDDLLKNLDIEVSVDINLIAKGNIVEVIKE